jgi:hypothetical protein
VNGQVDLEALQRQISEWFTNNPINFG